MLRQSDGAKMRRRKKISSTDLNYIFQENLKLYEEYPFLGIPIAIVPAEDGWMAVMTAKDRKRRSEWIERVESVQRELQKTYELRKS